MGKKRHLGEPPGLLSSWWWGFWDLFCAAPERRDTCGHSWEAKAFHDYRAAAVPSPVLGNVPPSDGMQGDPIPRVSFRILQSHSPLQTHSLRLTMLAAWWEPQSALYVATAHRRLRAPGQNREPGSKRSSWDTATAAQFRGSHRTAGPPKPGRVHAEHEPSLRHGACGSRPTESWQWHETPTPLLGPCHTWINMGPGFGRPWPNPTSANSIPYSSSSPGTYVGPPGGGSPPGTPLMCSPMDSTNSRSSRSVSRGVLAQTARWAAWAALPVSGPWGSDDRCIPKHSPNNVSGIGNPPGTPGDDGELGGNFLHSSREDNNSLGMRMGWDPLLPDAERATLQVGDARCHASRNEVSLPRSWGRASPCSPQPHLPLYPRLSQS